MQKAREHGLDTSDTFMLYELRSSTEGMSPEKMDSFLKITARRIKPNETQLGEYAFLNFFASPHYRDDFRSEMFDIIRRVQGPRLLKGVVKCSKCKDFNTSSEEFSNRAADEATKMRHRCNTCNKFWITS